MRLDKLHITNFRCFKDIDVSLSPNVTILFGENGSGKSTLIHAIHKSLSFIMHTEYVREKNTGKNKRKKKAKIIGCKSICSDNRYLHPEGISTNDSNNYNDPLIEIRGEGVLDDAHILPEWAMSVYAKNGRLRTSEYIDAFETFYEWHQETNHLPLLAYFSDCFPHVEDRKKKVVKAKVSSRRSFGYHDWNGIEGCTKEWIGRIENNLRDLNDAHNRIRQNRLNQIQAEKSRDALLKDTALIEKLNAENDAILDRLRVVSKGLMLGNKSFEISSLSLGKSLTLNSITGEACEFKDLPAGYKRLFGITIDLAFRSWILSEGATTNLGGIAIIDEIDLHLHPRLEKEIVNRITSAFNNIQFIVSTHSPLVLTGLRTCEGKNSILLMNPSMESPIAYPNIYGLDYNSALQEVMGVSKNDEELSILIDRCAYMISKGYAEQYERLKNHIVSLNLISSEEVERRIKLSKDYAVHQ